MGLSYPVWQMRKLRFIKLNDLVMLGQGQDSEASLGPRAGSLRTGLRTSQTAEDGGRGRGKLHQACLLLLFILPFLKSQLLLWTFPEIFGAVQKHATYFFCVCVVCVCSLSLIDFPLFNLEFSWTVVFRGSAVPQTGSEESGQPVPYKYGESHVSPAAKKIHAEPKSSFLWPA